MMFDEEAGDTTFDHAVAWHINQLCEKVETVDKYKKNLERLFKEAFDTEAITIHIQGNPPGVSVELILCELTQSDIEKLHEISDTYTISPYDTDIIALDIFSFKGVDD